MERNGAEQDQQEGVDITRLAEARGTSGPVGAIEDPIVIAKNLTHLGLYAWAPPRAPARHFALIQAA